MQQSKEDLALSSANGTTLLSLDDDALMAVLLRTRASDHPSLRLSCKRIRGIIDSFQFRKERSVQGSAEVNVELLSPFEQYKKTSSFREDPPSEDDDYFRDHYDELGFIYEYEDYYFETFCFRVFVDGRPLHKLKTSSCKSGSCRFSLPSGARVIATVKNSAILEHPCLRIVVSQR
jgi:hypothetical protein